MSASLRRAWVIVAVLWLMAAAMAPPGARAETPRWRSTLEGRAIVEVRVHGNRRMSDRDVMYLIDSAPGTTLDLDEVHGDVQQLYASGEFDDVQIDASPRGVDAVLVEILVVERPLVVAARFEGHDALEEEALREAAGLVLFTPRDALEINRARRRLLARYRAEGRPLAVVTVELQETEEGLVEAHFKIDEGAEIQTLEVSFVGNHALSDDTLRGWMRTRRAHPLAGLMGAGAFDPTPLSEDLERLRLVYTDHGHLDVRLSEPVVTYDRARRHARVTIYVEEGPAFEVVEVRPAGDLEGAPEALLSGFTLRPGEVFRASHAVKDLGVIRQHYQNRGFPDARVELKQERRAARQVVVVYELVLGARRALGRIEIEGNEATADRVIRDRIPIAEHESYDASALGQIEPRLMALGIFDGVDVSAALNLRRGTQDVRIRVEERDHFDYHLGGSVGVETLLGTGRLGYNNILGSGVGASVSVAASFERLLIDARVSAPYVLGSELSVSADFFRFDLTLDDFARSSLGGSLTLSYPLADALALQLVGRVEEIEVETDGGRRGRGWSGGAMGLFRGGLLSSVGLHLVYDSRDRSRFPIPGLLLRGTIEWSDAWVGSEVEFTRLEGRAQWGVEVGLGILVRLGASAGLVADWNADAAVPAIARYFLGGAGSVRGFVPRTLGTQLRAPRDGDDPLSETLDVTVGGIAKLTTSVEVEFPLISPWGVRGVVFFDAGDAFDDDPFGDAVLDAFDASGEAGLRSAVGFGLRWSNPSLPLRLEWGFPLARRAGEAATVLTFSAGLL